MLGSWKFVLQWARPLVLYEGHFHKKMKSTVCVRDHSTRGMEATASHMSTRRFISKRHSLVLKSDPSFDTPSWQVQYLLSYPSPISAVSQTVVAQDGGVASEKQSIFSCNCFFFLHSFCLLRQRLSQHILHSRSEQP